RYIRGMINHLQFDMLESLPHQFTGTCIPYFPRKKYGVFIFRTKRIEQRETLNEVGCNLRKRNFSIHSNLRKHHTRFNTIKREGIKTLNKLLKILLLQC